MITTYNTVFVYQGERHCGKNDLSCVTKALLIKKNSAIIADDMTVSGQCHLTFLYSIVSKTLYFQIKK